MFMLPLSSLSPPLLPLHIFLSSFCPQHPNHQHPPLALLISPRGLIYFILICLSIVLHPSCNLSSLFSLATRSSSYSSVVIVVVIVMCGVVVVVECSGACPSGQAALFKTDFLFFLSYSLPPVLLQLLLWIARSAWRGSFIVAQESLTPRSLRADLPTVSIPPNMIITGKDEPCHVVRARIDIGIALPGTLFSEP